MTEDSEAGEGSRRRGVAMKSRINPMCICMIQLEELGVQAKCCRDSGVWLRPLLVCVFVHEVTGGSGDQLLGSGSKATSQRAL